MLVLHPFSKISFPNTIYCRNLKKNECANYSDIHILGDYDQTILKKPEHWGLLFFFISLKQYFWLL